MLKRLLLASVMLVSIGASAHANTIRGAGAVSCGTWTANRNDGQHGVDVIMLHWALGYLSAQSEDILKNIDANGILYWLDDVCKRNPTIQFSYALEVFMAQQLGLLDKK